MQVEQAIAFAVDEPPAGLEIRINFGVFAGRDATTAELEELGRLLGPGAGEAFVRGAEARRRGAGLRGRTEAVLRAARDPGGDLGAPVHQRAALRDQRALAARRAI